MKTYKKEDNCGSKCAGIYIHIPFCVRKCSYCDFLSAPADAAARQLYVEKLKEELDQVCRRMLQKGEQLSTVYFGGGTPSLLTGEQLQDLMDVIKRAGLLKKRGVCIENAQKIDTDAENKTVSQELSPEMNPGTVTEGNGYRQEISQRTDAAAEDKTFSQEITLEMNPGTVTQEKLCQYKKAGINRLSIGVQSFHDAELQLLGRIHTSQDFRKAWQMARAAGFTNISIDLMSGLPGQTAEQWRDSLRQAAALNPEHISAYSLIIEEGTPFYERYGADWSETHEDLDREMYEDTNRILKEAGYHRYEISNYAKPGRESRHNSSYWTGIPYYGCGLGASSLLWETDGWYRTVNLETMQEYLEALTGNENEQSVFYQNVEKLTVKDRMEEFMFLGLRLTKGVSKTEFCSRFGVSMDDLYGKALKDLTDSGLLLQEKDGDQVHLTAKGLDLSNYCFAQFLLE